jgi:hypothetical protein
MNRREQIVVGFAAGLICPYLTFIVFWWTSAALALSRTLSISDRTIAAAAIAGLALGIILDVVYLKTWIASCYRVSPKLLVPIYLFCSLVAVASFMGFPIGNLALGTLAGIYAGRRMHHAGVGPESAARYSRRTGLFTATVTGLEALPIGVLALRERSAVRILQATFGMSEDVVTGLGGIGMVILTCVALAVVQFFCTKAAARFAFGMNNDRRFPTRGVSDLR